MSNGIVYKKDLPNHTQIPKHILHCGPLFPIVINGVITYNPYKWPSKWVCLGLFHPGKDVGKHPYRLVENIDDHRIAKLPAVFQGKARSFGFVEVGGKEFS